MCFLRLTLRVCVMEDEPVVFLAVLCDVTLTLDTEPGMQFPQGGSLRAVGGGQDESVGRAGAGSSRLLEEWTLSLNV